MTTDARYGSPQQEAIMRTFVTPGIWYTPRQVRDRVARFDITSMQLNALYARGLLERRQGRHPGLWEYSLPEDA